MTEAQASRIIELLEEIRDDISSIKTNTGNIRFTTSDLDDIFEAIQDISEKLD